jgi:hypothetical protein
MRTIAVAVITLAILVMGLSMRNLQSAPATAPSAADAQVDPNALYQSIAGKPLPENTPADLF